MTTKDELNLSDGFGASMIMGAGSADDIDVYGVFHMEHIRDGVVIYEETYRNTVTTAGKNLLLDTILGNSAAGAVVMGLKGTGSVVAGDTQGSHAGWNEVGTANAPAYSGTRKTPSFSSAASASKATSAAVSFTFTSGGTVAGSFINIGGSATQDNTTGTLFAAGDFSASRTVVNTDVINVTYTLNS